MTMGCNISRSSSTTRVLWNVNGLNSDVWQCIQSVTSHQGVQVWLIQEWKALHKQVRADVTMVTPCGWLCICGQAMAIVLVDPSLSFIESKSNEHSSRAKFRCNEHEKANNVKKEGEEEVQIERRWWCRTKLSPG